LATAREKNFFQKEVLAEGCFDDRIKKKGVLGVIEVV
jgi:hypothetical protein